MKPRVTQGFWIHVQLSLGKGGIVSVIDLLFADEMNGSMTDFPRFPGGHVTGRSQAKPNTDGPMARLDRSQGTMAEMEARPG